MLAKRRLLGFGRSIRLWLRHGALADATTPGQGARQGAEGSSMTGLRPDKRDHNPAGNLSVGVLPARFGEN